MQNFKDILPVTIRRPLGKLRAAVRRLKIWLHVRKTLTGATLDDSKVLQHAIRRSPLTIWHNLDQWQFPMVEDDCSVISKGIGTFNVRRRTDDLFHVLPMQEPAVETAIRSILRPGDTFVDAGANIGFYTVLASQLAGGDGHVIAFEMVPTTADILRSHVKRNDCANVKVIEGALAEVSGKTLKATIMSGKSGQASIARSGGTTEIDVETVSLAEQLADYPSIRLIKMDLEGAELGALKGLEVDLGKVQAIIFENRGAEDVVTFIEEHGFEVTRLDGNNALALRKRHS
jgi:FkbM family methyltransferase